MQGVEGVEFIAVNTDAQSLDACLASTTIQLGDDGLGAGESHTTITVELPCFLVSSALWANLSDVLDDRGQTRARTSCS